MLLLHRKQTDGIQTRWPKTSKLSQPSVLEPGSLEARCQRATLPLKAPGEGPPALSWLVAVAINLGLPRPVAASLQPLPALSRGRLIPVWLCVSLLL